MRLPRFAPLAFAIAAVFAATNDAQARYHGDLNLFVGQLWLTSGDWTPVDEQPELGLMFNFGEERAPIHVAIDLFSSSKEVSNTSPTGSPLVKGTSREIAIGVRKVWDQTVTRPHLGAGATAISVSEELNGFFGLETNEDRAYGAWVDLGVSWRLATHLNLGIEARYSYALATLGFGSSGREVDAGGIHLGLLIGYGW
jgi:hypothetical protein